MAREVQKTTIEEWQESLRGAGPPTDDDVTITPDGRRIDSKQKALDWLADLEEMRAAEAAGQDFSTTEKVAAFLAERQAAREARQRAGGA